MAAVAVAVAIHAAAVVVAVFGWAAIAVLPLLLWRYVAFLRRLHLLRLALVAAVGKVLFLCFTLGRFCIVYARLSVVGFAFSRLQVFIQLNLFGIASERRRSVVNTYSLRLANIALCFYQRSRCGLLFIGSRLAYLRTVNFHKVVLHLGSTCLAQLA